MAQYAVVRISDLSKGFVLSPERYDPRRQILHNGIATLETVSLGSIAQLIKETISPTKCNDDSRKFLVLDTSDATEGIITCRKQPVPFEEIGSAKKVIKPGDVIISRLRPYLRQVAYVDDVFERNWADVILVCSTEYFVLRSIDSEDIAFLAPFLLTNAVQSVLGASQEGGHHPRFNAETLLDLPIPKSLLQVRIKISKEVRKSVDLYRNAQYLFKKQQEQAEKKLHCSNV